MKIAPNLDQYILFILLVLPGFISMKIYRLLMPAKEIDWKNSIVEAIFYSSINFALILPVIIPIHQTDFINNNLFWYQLLMFCVIFIIPILLPLSWVKLIKNKHLMKKLQLPYPTSWDYFFDKREPVYVLIQLKNGNKIGGFYGSKSYATSFPREGDLYIEKAIKVDAHGNFKAVIKDSHGILIRKEDYELIEFFQTESLRSPKK